MKAYEHTKKMLTWWGGIDVTRIDLAVRQAKGGMILHRDLAIHSLPLEWARAQNVQRAEVYVRPARQYAWPVVFLDDVATPTARAIANKYDALVIETSPVGGCHVWLACVCALNEPSRREAQRWLAQRIDADLASISGEHLGRLAGFRNWKRDGTWVNVAADSLRGRRWEPSVVPMIAYTEPYWAGRLLRQQRKATDTSPSGREWGWVCGQLEKGCPPERVYVRLLERACLRRGSDAPRYAHRTLERALRHTGRAAARRTRPREIPPQPEDMTMPRA